MGIRAKKIEIALAIILIFISISVMGNGSKENVNFLSWSNVPDASIYYNALDANGIAVDFQMALSTGAGQEIEVHDAKKVPVSSDIKTYDEAKIMKKEVKKSSKFSTTDIPSEGELEVDALTSKNVAVKLKVNKADRGEIILDDFGKDNPVSVPLPGRAVKYVEIGANNIPFTSANITIRYTDAELNGRSESELTIYHWNGAAWEAMPTIVDTVNKTLSATTTSLSFWGVATPYSYALRCDSGTSIGTSDTTDTVCDSSSPYSSMRTALLLDPTGTTGSTIQFSSFSGTQLYAYFVNNTAYSTDVNVTGIDGSISMDRGMGGGTVYGKLELGYYDPNGTSDNFVNLFNSTETTGVTGKSPASYSVSFNNQYGIIPANNKLAIRVWMRTTVSRQPSFYTYRTTSGYDSSVNIRIATPNASISGYVTDASSGVSLSGATVQINTSLPPATTNAAGAYNFTGLSNGTYMINASLTGYITNSINVTISGADNTTANITVASAASSPDLVLTQTNISFSYAASDVEIGEVKENVNVTINATIYNNGSGSASNVKVSFYDGTPGSGNNIANTTIASLNAGASQNATVYWNSLFGTHNISVRVDPDNNISESDKTNNNASKLINVSAWQKYYGNISGNLSLKDQPGNFFSNWTWGRLSGNVFITNISSLNFSNLQALGRNKTGGIAQNNFSRADVLLNMTPGSDNATGFTNNNITQLFSTDGTNPRNTTSFTVYGTTINNVAIVNSTNVTNSTSVENATFITGILWDTTKDKGGGEYGDDSEYLVFISKINVGKTGLVTSLHDHEIAIPSSLKGAGVVYFYVELK